MYDQTYDDIKTDLDEELKQKLDYADRRRRLFRNVSKSNNVIIAGYGSKGRSLSNYLSKIMNKNILIYDKNEHLKYYENNKDLQFINENDIEKYEDIPLIICSCQNQIEQQKIFKRNSIFYEEASCYFEKPHHFNQVSDFSEWVLSNKDYLSDFLISLRPDDRRRLRSILSFRVSLDPADLIGQRSPVGDMWFDVPRLVGTRRYSSFLDVGAYDGDTLLTGRDALGFNRAIAIEANSSMADSIRENAAAYQKLDLIPCAAWSHECYLEFSQEERGMLSVSEAVNGGLRAEKLDDVCQLPIDFIKMDIEGAELPALTGASDILATKPDLAVAAYHRPEDLFTIREFLKEMRFEGSACRQYIRHYSDCLDDTILYYIWD